MAMRVAAVIAAAGAGTRLSSTENPHPKALRSLAGRSLLDWAVAALSPLVDHIVVAVPPAVLGDLQGTAGRFDGPVTVVAGGATRQESVRRGLAALPADTELVLVHDAARPLVPAAVIVRVLDALRGGAVAVVPAVPLADALRQVGSDSDSVSLERTRLRAVQTPQGFRADVLLQAHRAAEDLCAADDAVLVERCGLPVVLVEGSELSFKITSPLDLELAEAVIRTADGDFQR